MDRLEQKLRQMRASDGVTTWEDFDVAPVTSLPAKFRMPEIERYAGIGCPRIHLRLYSTVMRAHGLDKAEMVMLFPMSLSSVAQRWFASLDASRHRTWDDLAQEFLRQFAFNTVIDVSRRELEALRKRLEESITSFISRWREKISQIIDRPLEKDQINMIMRSLQPRFARHLMGFPHTDFRSLVQALYGIEEDIAKDCGPSLPLLILRGRSLQEDRDQEMLALLVQQERDLLDTIGQLDRLLDSTIHHHPMCSIGHMFPPDP